VSRARLALPREPSCRLCQDVTLRAQAMVLTSKAPQFIQLSLSADQCACRGLARLASPKWKLELMRQLTRRASRSHQIDHLSPELRRISGSVAGVRHLKNQLQGCPSKPGQLHCVAELEQMAICDDPILFRLQRNGSEPPGSPIFQAYNLSRASQSAEKSAPKIRKIVGFLLTKIALSLRL
jgi:hypothetical protein